MKGAFKILGHDAELVAEVKLRSSVLRIPIGDFATFVESQDGPNEIRLLLAPGLDSRFVQHVNEAREVFGP